MALRTVLTVMVALGVGLLLAAVLVLRDFSLDDYKDDIAAEVNDLTGRELELKGPIAFRLAWPPIITASDLTLSNAAWASEPEMLAIDSLFVRFDLLRLLTGRLDPTHVDIVGAELFLERGSDGQASWDLAVTPEHIEQTEEYLGGTFPYLRKVRVKTLAVTYRDQASGGTLQGKVERLKAAVGNQGERVRLELDATVNEQEIYASSRLETLQALALGGSSPLTASLQAGQARLDLDGTVGAAEALDITFEGSGSEVGALAALAGYRPPRLGAFKLSGRARGTADGLTLDPLDLAVGRSDLKGTVTLAWRERPAIQIDLTSGVVDLTPLVEALGAPAGDSGSNFFDDPLPVETLAAVDVALQLSVERLHSLGAQFDLVLAKVDLKNGDLKIDPFKLDYRGATFSGKLALQAAEPAKLSGKILTQDFDLGSLLKEHRVTDLVKGKIDFGLDVAGSGRSLRAILGDLTGTGSFVMGKGEIASRYVDLIAADLMHLLVPWKKGITEAKVTCALGQLTSKDGLVTSQALLLDTENIRMSGKGTLNLKNDKLDLLLSPRPKDPTLISLATRLRVTGILGDLSVAPDPLSLALEAAEGIAGVLLLGPAGILIPFASLGAGHHHDCVNDLQKMFGTVVAKRLGETQPGGQPASATAPDQVTAVPSDVLLPIAGDRVTPSYLSERLSALGFTKIANIEKAGAIFHLEADWQGKPLKLRIDANLGKITLKDPG